MPKIFLALLSFISLSCHSQNCQNLPTKFISYNRAADFIEHSSYKINENVNTSKSSWITNVHYYSCDGITGFLIIWVQARIYIHSKVPVDVWRQFKIASSFGSFYDHYIKGKYQFHLN
ncbi:MAG: KTSC domain-containing protein [Ginsengibacter sp.]